MNSRCRKYRGEEGEGGGGASELAMRHAEKSAAIELPARRRPDRPRSADGFFFQAGL